MQYFGFGFDSAGAYDVCFTHKSGSATSNRNILLGGQILGTTAFSTVWLRDSGWNREPENNPPVWGGLVTAPRWHAPGTAAEEAQRFTSSRPRA